LYFHGYKGTKKDKMLLLAPLGTGMAVLGSLALAETFLAATAHQQQGRNQQHQDRYDAFLFHLVMFLSP
jgi:hypothetical protein